MFPKLCCDISWLLHEVPTNLISSITTGGKGGGGGGSVRPKYLKEMYDIVLIIGIPRELVGVLKKNSHGEVQVHVHVCNRPFPSSLVPLFQSESKCKIILMKMTLICMKMELYGFCRTHFHMKGFTLRLVLKERHKRIWK